MQSCSSGDYRRVRSGTKEGQRGTDYENFFVSILTDAYELCIMEKNIVLTSTNRKSTYSVAAPASREW